MATRTGRKIAHYAAGGGALPTDATAQGMPAATNSLGIQNPGPQTTSVGSYGAAAEQGGIAGDTNVSPVGAPDTSGFSASLAPDKTQTQPEFAPAAASVAATPSPVKAAAPSGGLSAGGYEGQLLGNMFEKGGAIPDKVEHFAGGGRSGHGGYKIAGDPNATLNEDNDMVAKFNEQARTHVSRRFTDTAETTAPPGGQQQQPSGGGGGGGGGGQRGGGGGGGQRGGGGGGGGGQQPSGSSSSLGWSGGLDSLPGGGGDNSTGSGSTTTSPSPEAPTDAFGSQAYPPAQQDPSSSGAIPDGSTPGQGGVPTDAMGSPGTGGGISMTGGGGARGGRVTRKGIVPPKFADGGATPGSQQDLINQLDGHLDPMDPNQPLVNKDGSLSKLDPGSESTGFDGGGVVRRYDKGGALPDPDAHAGGIDPTTLQPGWEGPIMDKDGELSAQDPGSMDQPPPAVSNAVANTAKGGAIPDTADVPIDQDQGQEGDAGDLFAQVKSVLSATRKQYGLTDKAFQMSGNMPTKPAGPGGDQTQGGPQDRSNPPPVSENNDDDSEKQAVS